MNRRGFLASLLAVPVVAAPALDLGRRIFLPPRGGWPSNTLTLEMIVKAKRALMQAPVPDGLWLIQYREEFILAFEQRRSLLSAAINRRVDQAILKELSK